jgi:hypothetical protein
VHQKDGRVLSKEGGEHVPDKKDKEDKLKTREAKKVTKRL